MTVSWASTVAGVSTVVKLVTLPSLMPTLSWVTVVNPLSSKTILYVPIGSKGSLNEPLVSLMAALFPWRLGLVAVTETPGEPHGFIIGHLAHDFACFLGEERADEKKQEHKAYQSLAVHTHFLSSFPISAVDFGPAAASIKCFFLPSFFRLRLDESWKRINTAPFVLQPCLTDSVVPPQ